MNDSATDPMEPDFLEIKPEAAQGLLLPAAASSLPIKEVKAQAEKIHELIRDVMIEGRHYGVIEGTKEPFLYKPGAQKLNFTFRLAPRYKIERIDLDNEHREYQTVCRIYSIETGKFLGEGAATASTKETKWRYRNAKRKCPACGEEAILESKPEYGGGWFCFAKIGGCSAKFAADDTLITGQEVGKTENENPADFYNTALKMSVKRAHAETVLYVLAASDIFDPGDDKLDPTIAGNGASPQGAASDGDNLPPSKDQPGTPSLAALKSELHQKMLKAGVADPKAFFEFAHRLSGAEKEIDLVFVGEFLKNFDRLLTLYKKALETSPEQQKMWVSGQEEPLPWEGPEGDLLHCPFEPDKVVLSHEDFEASAARGLEALYAAYPKKKTAAEAAYIRSLRVYGDTAKTINDVPAARFADVLQALKAEVEEAIQTSARSTGGQRKQKTKGVDV